MTYQRSADFMPHSSKQAELMREIAAAGGRDAGLDAIPPAIQTPTLPVAPPTPPSVSQGDQSQIAVTTPEVDSGVSHRANVEPDRTEKVFAAARGGNLADLEQLIAA